MHQFYLEHMDGSDLGACPSSARLCRVQASGLSPKRGCHNLVLSQQGSPGRDSPMPGHLAYGTVLFECCLPSSFTAFALQHSHTGQMPKPPHRASNPAAF